MKQRHRKHRTPTREPFGRSACRRMGLAQLQLMLNLDRRVDQLAERWSTSIFTRMSTGVSRSVLAIPPTSVNNPRTSTG